MNAEASIPQEAQNISPVQGARAAVNNELFGQYDGNRLRITISRLHNALLEDFSEMPVDRTTEAMARIYHELMIVSGQGSTLAETRGDVETANDLKEQQRAFELTYEVFRPKMQQAGEVRLPIQPTRTETLPPMTSAKGMELSPQPQAQTRRQTPEQKQETPATTSAEQRAQTTETQELTFGSFLRQKRTEANLSQGRLAEAAGGLPQPLISALERGRGTADPERITQIATALNLNSEDTQKLLDLYKKQSGKNQ